MSNKKSSELSREEEERAQLDAMMGDAFGGVEEIQVKESEQTADTPTPDDEDALKEKSIPQLPLDSDDEEKSEDVSEEESSPITKEAPSLPPSSPPTGPPSGPPGGPPSSPAPVESEPSEESDDTPVEEQGSDEPTDIEPEQAATEETAATGEEPSDKEEQLAENDTESNDSIDEEPAPKEMPSIPSEDNNPQQSEQPKESKEQGEGEDAPEPEPSSAELETLQHEVHRLEHALEGAVEVIKDLEEPEMPPLVEGNIVIAGHLVGDFVRLGKQLDRDHLVRGNLGGMAMLHPGQPGVMIATRHMVMLSKLDERSLCIGQMGSGSVPRGATTDWRSFEVVLAAVSMVTGGPGAALRIHSPFTTAVSCEQDLVLVQPIDEIGKQLLGKIIIVEPDEDDPDNFLRQLVEALQQGGMRAVVVRGHGAFAVGADFDQAWANAAMLEHSMQVYLLARQANLKF